MDKEKFEKIKDLPVDFSYPDGLNTAAELLDMVPEPMRIPMIIGGIGFWAGN